MYFKSSAFSFAFAVSGIFLLSASAKGDDFSFSFTNTVGDVSGTVTGEILGLTDNSTSAAVQVLIESFPSGLDSVFGSGPIDATQWYEENNSFTETDGAITAASFYYLTGPDALLIGLYDGSLLDLSEAGGLEVLNKDGLAGDNFQLTSSSSAPEPTTWLLFATGLGGMALLKNHRVRMPGQNGKGHTPDL